MNSASNRQATANRRVRRPMPDAGPRGAEGRPLGRPHVQRHGLCMFGNTAPKRSEEHTSELQSQSNLVCRLLLEKKKSHTITAGLRPRRPEYVCRADIVTNRRE